jgi:hypothetical protein
MSDDDNETNLTGDKDHSTASVLRTRSMMKRLERSAYLGSYKSKFRNARKRPITLPKLKCLKDDVEEN